MSLRDDDRALLQLLCERGQSYDDLAGQLGIPADELRGKARAALEQLGGADPDAEVGLSDYLLGQADPIGRADVVRYLQGDPEALELARELSARLQLIAPAAELPKLPEARSRRRRAAVSADSAPAGEDDASRASLGERVPQGQARLIAGLAGGGLVLLFAILAIAGVFSGEDATGADVDADAEPVAVSVPLEARGDSGVQGRADFATTDEDQLFVDLSVDGLDPEPEEETLYMLWLMLDREQGLPVAPIQPQANGSVRDRYPVPTPMLAWVQSATLVDIGRLTTRDAQRLGRALENADDGDIALEYVGQSLARGRIPAADPAELGGLGDDPAELGGLGDDPMEGIEQLRALQEQLRALGPEEREQLDPEELEGLEELERQLEGLDDLEGLEGLEGR